METVPVAYDLAHNLQQGREDFNAVFETAGRIETISRRWI